MSNVDFDLIFINNGDAVLQTDTFAAVFVDMAAMAQCVQLLLNGESPHGWEGHDDDYRVNLNSDTFRDAVQNGGYKHYSADDILNWAPDYVGWQNIREFAAAFTV